MASLDSYIKERDERIEKGTLIYSKAKSSITRINFNQLNEKTFKQNNFNYHDRTKFYF